MTSRQYSPALMLTGFVLLLGAMFGIAYAVGSAAGPVAPELHRSDDGGSGGDMGGMNNHGTGVVPPAPVGGVPAAVGGAQ